MDEFPADVDITRHARYWQEAFNGVVMRMALLALFWARWNKIKVKLLLHIHSGVEEQLKWNDNSRVGKNIFRNLPAIIPGFVAGGLVLEIS